MKNALWLACAAAGLAPVALSAKKAPERPNLLLIMTDQQRYDALGVAGKFPFLKTPNLDRLARTGAYFSRAYTQCAVSAPVRTTILTGMTIYNHKMFTNERTKEDPASYGFTHGLSFDQVLSRNGYYVEHHGKLHTPTVLADCYLNYKKVVDKNGRVEYVGEDKADYFAYIESIYGKLPFKDGDLWDTSFRMPYTPDPLDRRYGKGTDYRLSADEQKIRKHSQPDQHGKLPIKAEHSFTAYQAKNAIQALERAAKSGKPFSVTCSFMFPHAPMLPTEPYYSMYPLEQMPVSASIADPMKDSPYASANGRKSMPEYSDPQKIRYMMSSYFGLVTEIDTWVGELLKTLKRIGADKNTLVIFVSDHGEMLGSHGMREKNVFFEESARVPLIVNFPGKIKPVTVDRYVSNLDLYATILDYLGVKAPGKNDSRSLRGLIEGTDKTRGEYLVTEWLYRGPTQPNYMVVKDNWKLYVPYTPDSKVINVLHDLNTDPYEMKNLLSGPDKAKYMAKAEELKACLVQWLKEHDNTEHAQSVAARKL